MVLLRFMSGTSAVGSSSAKIVQINFIRRHDPTPEVPDIKQENHAKLLLGITVDCDLTWTFHMVLKYLLSYSFLFVDTKSSIVFGGTICICYQNIIFQYDSRLVSILNIIFPPITF